MLSVNWVEFHGCVSEFPLKSIAVIRPLIFDFSTFEWEQNLFKQGGIILYIGYLVWEKNHTKRLMPKITKVPI